jgi:hypothetical protein
MLKKATRLNLITLMQDYYGRRSFKQPERERAADKIFSKLAGIIGGRGERAPDKDIKKAWQQLDRQKLKYVKNLEQKNKIAA